MAPRGKYGELFSLDTEGEKVPSINTIQIDLITSGNVRSLIKSIFVVRFLDYYWNEKALVINNENTTFKIFRNINYDIFDGNYALITFNPSWTVWKSTTVVTKMKFKGKNGHGETSHYG